jgi:CRP/FNR family transcriptional regulator, cyclic AMP receptor protein
VDKPELLRKTVLFEGLTEADLRELAGKLTERTFRAGETIFNQGDAATAMFIVGGGNVNIHLPGEESRRVSLKDLARGEYFGELSLFDHQPRSASALATTDVVLLELTAETLSSYLERRPTAAIPILRTMTARLRETNTLLSERASKNVVAEIDKSLTWKDRLADRVAELNGSWTCILGLMAITVGWAFANTRGPGAFDPYPFVFYNLVLAILVALQGPLIVMSQNRESSKDRAQSQTDYLVNLKNEVNIETILRELGELRAEVAQSVEAKRDAGRSTTSRSP